MTDAVRDWALDAHCKEAGPDVDFFTTDITEQRRLVKQWCVSCLVRADCTAEALSRGPNHIHGIWGDTPARLRKLDAQRTLEQQRERQQRGQQPA